MNALISPMRVLLLECHEEAYQRVKQALEEGDDRAYHVLWAPGGETARHLMRQENIGVCLVGQAPDLSGGVHWIQRCLEQGWLLPYIVLGNAESLNGNPQFERLETVDFLDERVLGPMTLKRRIAFALARTHTQLQLMDSENQNQLLFENLDFRARQHRLFKQLLDDNRDAILVVDDAGKVHYANLTAQQLFGKDSEVLTRFPVTIPDSPAGLLEWELVGRYGERVAFEAHHAYTEWNNEPMHLLSMRDVTSRKETESQLRILQRSLEASSNGVVITDARLPDHPILYVNPAFE